MNNKLRFIFLVMAVLFSFNAFSQDSRIPSGKDHAGGGLDSTGINAPAKGNGAVYQPPSDSLVWSKKNHEEGSTSSGCDSNQQSCAEDQATTNDGGCDSSQQSCDDEGANNGGCDSSEQSCADGKPNPMAGDTPELTEEEARENNKKKKESITGPVRQYQEIDVNTGHEMRKSRSNKLIRTLPDGASTVEGGAGSVQPKSRCDLADPRNIGGCKDMLGR